MVSQAEFEVGAAFDDDARIWTHIRRRSRRTVSISESTHPNANVGGCDYPALIVRGHGGAVPKVMPSASRRC